MKDKAQNILFIVGNRPQFIKIAPVLKAMEQYPELNYKLIHTGQHYDYNLSQQFFDELKIPPPDYHLECGSGTPTQQFIRIISGLDELMKNERPALVVVVGDTNTTSAGAVWSAINQFRLAHIESGLREWDKSIPEEINKLLTDAVSDLYFCPTQTAVENLRRQHVTGKIILSGDPGLDLLFNTSSPESGENLLSKWNLKVSEFYLATCHRQINTDDRERLETILTLLSTAGKPVLLSLHPRLAKAIIHFDLGSYLRDHNIIACEPLGFRHMQTLISSCDKVITDSGGLVKEAYFHRKYVIIIDRQTEWVEVVREGKGQVVGVDFTGFREALQFQFKNTTPSLSLGDGNASAIIAAEINSFMLSVVN